MALEITNRGMAFTLLRIVPAVLIGLSAAMLIVGLVDGAGDMKDVGYIAYVSIYIIVQFVGLYALWMENFRFGVIYLLCILVFFGAGFDFRGHWYGMFPVPVVVAMVIYVSLL